MLRQRFRFPWTWQTVFSNINYLAWRTDAGNRTKSRSFSFAVSLGLLNANLLASEQISMAHLMLSLLSYLIFNTHAQSVKREGHSLMKKENTQISRLLRLLHCSAVMLVNSTLLQYCGYCDSPIWKHWICTGTNCIRRQVRKRDIKHVCGSV